MPALPQLILDGAITGAAFALMAVGLSLILGVVKVVNLSHGAFFTLGAYAAVALSRHGTEYHPVAAVLLGGGVAFALGMFLGKSFINPIRSHPFSVTVGTLAFSLLFEQAAQFLWGPHPQIIAVGRSFPGPLGTTVRMWGAAAFLACTALLAALQLLLSSRWGLPLKLIAENEEIAESVGINAEKVRYLTFGAASALAAVAGALLAPAAAIVPTMGRGPLILSLIVVIVSGMENLAAGFVLAVGLGLLSNLGAYYLASEWSYILLLATVCVLLAFRPAGWKGVVITRDV
ncbi:MAG: branched-chain amino acid ABC transporter permease [Deltaproteobacteria bacterium]|nr:branched-chain amino acid ABC transporter permease [Deltaproteobacteria bacterium]